MTSMRAAVYRRYGPPEVVEVCDVERPAPRDGEVLVRVHASTVCAADWRLRQADPFFIRLINGLARPRRMTVLGAEIAGTVEAVGGHVTRFAVGDLVFGALGLKFGGHAEYACAPQGALTTKPANMSLEEAAAILFGGVSALYFLRRANVTPGQQVLVYGASGSVGVFAVQLAKHFGARVTAVCSTANLELVRSLGADQVVDYTREDFARAGPVYDVVVDTVGKGGVRRILASLKPGGVYALIAPPPLLSLPRALWAALSGRAKVVTGMARGTPGDADLLRDLIEAGKLRTVIDRRYPLAEIAEAHRHAQGGHKKGHVVVLMGAT